MADSNRYERLIRRRAPQEDRILKSFAEAYERQPGSDTRFILGAMRAVDKQYTDRLVEQGNRVENQLSTRLSREYPGIEFRRQGSVSNFTHIRYSSDVDVLTIIDKFVTLEPPQRATYPYTGNPVDDLVVLRRRCVQELGLAFPKVDVDDSGSTSVNLTGGSLACNVDVVPSNWYDTVSYAQSNQEYLRGIQVLKRDTGDRIKNYPFLFNHHLHQFDLMHRGMPRMFIRLLKTIKADLEEEGTEIGFSSFDICSIVYRIPDKLLLWDRSRPLEMVSGLITWMAAVITGPGLQTSLQTVDDSRLVFDSPAKLPALGALFTELRNVYGSAIAEQAGRTLLSEAHVS